ncbi:MAG: sulfatase [Planctomycetota bacterium]|nr:sulfatase [Planctomycetota bacterium]
MPARGRLLAAACSRSDPGPPLPPILETETVLALLDDPARRSGGNADAPAAEVYEMRMPITGGAGARGPMRALRAPAPFEIKISAPERPADAEFSFAVSVESGDYGGKGAVAFTVEVDGAPVWTRSVDCSASVRAAARTWVADRISLPPGEALTLRASYEGNRPQAPRVSFGLLEFVRDRELPRRSSRAKGANVVLVLIDTLRADGLGTLGNPRPVSPELDALAQRGVVFERAYSPAPWTVPSTASLLTGLTPPEHGSGFAGKNFLDHRLLTLAEVFARNGFTTAAFSNNKLISEARNFGQGFESFTLSPWELSGETMGGVETWLEQKRDERFFLYLHLIDPHAPYDPPAPHRARFAADVPLSHPKDPDNTLTRIFGGRAPPAQELQDFARVTRQLYDGETSYADEQIGRLVTRLQELGLDEDTVIAITSDHGEEFLEHGLMGHVHHLHEELVRVPMILAGPGVPQGKRITRTAEMRFLGPTLMRLARAEDRTGLPDADLLDDRAWLGRENDPIFFTTHHGRLPTPDGTNWGPERALHGVRQADWFYVWAPAAEKAGASREFLYNRALDPAERNDLAAVEADRCAHLRSLIEVWLDRSLGGSLSGEADEQDRADMRALGYVDD